MRLGAWPVLALITTLALASGFLDFRIRLFPDYAYATYIPKVIDGSYGAPAIYRVLVPYGNTWLGYWSGWQPATVWHVTRIGWFLAAYLVTFAYLRTWFSPQAALGGVCGVAATLPLTCTNSWAHPDSIPELALFTLGCLAIVRKADSIFFVTLVVAALNRETSAFLVLAYALSRKPDRSHLMRTAAAGVLWAGVFLGLRAWRGVQPYDYWQLGRNLEFMKLLPPGYDLYKRFYAWFAVALAGPALLVILSRWRQVPDEARRLLVVAVPFAATGMLLSSIIESRIFIPLYPLLLPALLFVLLEPIRKPEDSAGAL